MIIYPAVDIQNGNAVRLKKGDFNQSKIYYADPVDAAKKWIAEGASVLHVVDLDGAKEGRPVNIAHTKRIAELGIKVQLGGGIRNIESLREAFKNGAWRCVLGTALIKNKNLAKAACEEFSSDRIVAGVDLKGGKVAIEGWQEGLEVDYRDLLAELKEIGIVNIIVTDVDRDGMQEGPNFNLMKELISKYNFNVIASGGVSSLNDIRQLVEIGVAGAITGTALYEGSFTLSQALEVSSVS